MSPPNELRRRGWTLLRDQPFLRPDGTADPARCLALAERWGRPSGRDGGPAPWPVRAARASGTFSQTPGAAPLHTDAAYRARPEPGMCLFAVRPARDGGRTLLLDAAAALAGLPDRTLRRLGRADWSWRTPEPFPPEPPFRAAVAARAGLRWRADLLVFRDAGQRAAARRFARHLARVPAVELALRPGDVLVVDNRRLLHGRTAFTDPARLLLRVRLRTLP
ncbi:TauD/TfdA family dioxygenase [Actinomadura algeriensis]|uniref:Alpha-ketoglutarate-dependent taurine dioxygenase n=1 Tax=Actinomadura algeriensis TaxID=1679523 RepID=A0ABR9K3E3_9ACTN|nr:TauD/TfdA family dioxygenase [Actinomadura algeriensis]MBE1537046.1 alpha-ketoglutarate-dependent taurine dioxygenase [Actinomadura algeriensis]